MSSTAPSFIDDGISFTRRLPTIHHPQPAPSSASSYTGSYIDDGADLLPPTPSRGFGAIDYHFYKSNPRRSKADGAWSHDIARAVGGDIQRSLSRVYELGGIGVKKASDADGEGRVNEKVARRRREEKKGVVFVPGPVRWGTFVIKGEDGRVVVVGETGEWDSGAVGGEGEGTKKDEKVREGKRWVRAASTISDDTAPSLVNEVSEIPQQEDTESRREGSSPQSDYEPDSPVTLPLASPTDFFMTGGLSGWPSRTGSPEPTSPIIPLAITWETSPARTESAYVSEKSYPKPTSARSKIAEGGGKWNSSPSSLHGWPAEGDIASRHSSMSRDGKSWPVESRSGSRYPTSHALGFDIKNAAEKANSNYNPPDIVEVIYDQTPPGELFVSQVQWAGAGECEDGAWDATSTSTSRGKQRNERDEAGSVLWGHDGSVKESIWGESHGGSHADSQAGSTTKDMLGWDDEGQQVDKEGEWDGFERPKTESEVSVYGGSQFSRRSHCSQRSHRGQNTHHSGGSQASWPASVVSGGSHSRRREDSHRSTRSRNRHGRGCSDLGWDGEGKRSKAGSGVHWDDGVGMSIQNWAA